MLTKLYNCPLLRLAMLGLCVVVSTTSFCSEAWATPPHNWEVLRVFIKDDTEQVNKLVTGNYKNIRLDDLEDALAKHNNLRKVLPLRTVALEDAIYIARLDGESILSDQSRWKLTGADPVQPLVLENISLPLRAARYIAPSSKQLTEFAVYTPSGIIELPVNAEGSDYWFGFSINSQEQESGRVFRFRIPPAVTAKLLVATPTSIDLSSPTLVVEKVISLASQLPGDWSSTTPQVGSGSQWWLVHLSGVSQFELSAKPSSETDLTRFKCLAQSAVVEYMASPEHIVARASFSVVGHRPSAPLRIQASRDFRIETVLVNGLPISWRFEPSLSGNTNLIALSDLNIRSDEIEIELQAICHLDTSRAIELPLIALAEAYAMDGKTRVFSRGGLVVDSLVAQSASGQDILPKRVLRPLAEATNDASSAYAMNKSGDEPLVWQASWLGSQPQFVAQFSQQRKPTLATTLTRFSIQDEWLAANCRLRIESSQIQSNEFRLPVGDGWFIDSVRLIGAEPFVRVRLEDRIDAANPIIVIHWEGDRQQLSIDLEVLAHSPQAMNSDLVSLRSPRLLTLPQADQVDYYAIQTSSRFAVQVGPKLLPYQRQPFDLPKWQQDLVPTNAKPWIFQGVSGNIPPINLVATSGTFTSSILTVLQPSPSKTRLLTQIDCTPTLGSIDRLSIALPPGARASDWEWSLHQPGQIGERVVLNAVPLEDASDPSDEQQTQIVELELPTPQANPFVLTCELQIDKLVPGAELRVPIVGIPAVVGEKSLLLLPPELAQSLSHSNIELLPGSSMANHVGRSDLALHIPSELANQQDEVHVAVRMDAAISQWLTLSPPVHPLPLGWVWSETLRHTLSENGRVEHDIRWVVEGNHLKPLEVTLPEGWSVEQVWIDEVLTDSPPNAQFFLLQLQQQGRTTVRICCSSQHVRPGWLSYIPTQRPSLSLPILTSRTTSAIPPSRLAVRNLLSRWGTPEAQSRLVDRLLPRFWWKLLVPFQSTQPMAINSIPQLGPSLPAGWSSIESSSNTLFPFVSRFVSPNDSATSVSNKGEWTISRSAFSAIIIAMVMIVATFFWSCLKVSLWRWWVAATLSVLGVILVPAWLLAPAQLVLLALGLAGLLRLCLVVFIARSSSPTKPRGRSSVLQVQPSISTTSAIVLIGLGGVVNGQSVPNSNGSLSPMNPRFENQIAEEGDEQQPEIFSVLIPVDESGEAAGEYAFAPTRLLDLLEKGGNVTSREVPPKIRSAEYTLRMRRGLTNSPDQVQELFVDLHLQVAQVDIELRLPFDSRQLQLQSGSVGEQELYVGGRSLYQLPDAIVFRPYSTGNLRLQLHFEPLNIEFSETQAELRCSIPTLPTATLRIIADNSSNFQVLSSGAGRKTITTEYTELLGPVSELDVLWSPSSPRTMAGQNSAEVFADTWLYARGGQVSAICQLRIENARSLPRDMKVVAEPGWEPVGLSWEYGELLANEVSAMGGRRVYTIRGHDGWDQLSRRVLRVLMVPRNEADLSSLSVPFLSLRDVSPLTAIRTLAWSAEEGAAWQPDGLDLWQELKYMPGLEWGKFNWRVRPQLFRMAGTLATSLRPSSSVPADLIDEMTQVRLSQGEATLTYRGQFTSPQPQAMSLIIPRQARVDSLLVDGSATNYRRSERGEQASIEILTDDRPTHGRVVDLAISQRLEIGQPLPAPRVFVRGSQASRSVYRVLCGAGLECHLTSSDDLKLNPTTLLPREQLAALETMVGQIDIGNSYRKHPALPMEMEIRPRPVVPLVGSVLALEPSEQGWQATLTTQWKSGNQPLDFVFFELPSSILDSIDVGQLPAQFTTHGDSGRMTMSLIAPPPVSDLTEVEFRFTLRAAPSIQSLAIPHISVLTESPSRPLLALPDAIAGQKVEWSQPGRRLDAPPGVSLGKNRLEGYQFFEVEPTRTQVSWKRFQAVDRSAQLLVSHITLLDHQYGRIAGVADYWLSPHGQKDFFLTLPEHCHVLGVDIGGRPALWSQEQRQLKILLQPNFLPLVVRVLLQWETTDLESMALALPFVVNAEANEQTLQFVENHLPNLRADATPGNSIQTGIQQEVSQLWLQLVVESFEAIRKRSPHDTRAWLELWNPSLVGIDSRIVVQPDQPTMSVLELSPDASEEPISRTAHDLWQRMWELLQAQDDLESDSELPEVESAAVRDGKPTDEWPAQALTSGPKQFIRLSNQQDKLTLREVAPVSGWTAQWIAAGMLATAAMLILLLAQRLAGIYLKLMSVQPWVYWLQLGVVAWFLLPLSWPSWVLVATAVGLLATQLIQNQRRQRSLART